MRCYSSLLTAIFDGEITSDRDIWSHYAIYIYLLIFNSAILPYQV
jgi:hypothetical protein